MENLDTLEKQIIELYGEATLETLKSLCNTWNEDTAIFALELLEQGLLKRKHAIWSPLLRNV